MDDKQLARICSRADEVREIAQGIFDKAERRVVLKFVADAKKLAAKLSHADASRPTK